MNRNATKKRSVMPRVSTLLIMILLLPIPALIYGTYWSGLQVNEITGPTHLAQDSSGNIYIIENDNLLITDSDGNLLDKYSLDIYGITEPLADIYATREGNIIFGLRKSNTIKEYLREGGTPLIYNITPVSKTLEDFGAYFHFTMDEDYGTLYITDSRDGALTVYDNSGMALKTLRTPSGAPPNETQVSGDNIDSLKRLFENIRNVMPDLKKRTDMDFPYNWPNTVVLHNRSIYVADTNNFRIIKLTLDGEMEDIILADPVKGSPFGRITNFSVYADKIYALFKSTVIKGGLLVRLDVLTNEMTAIEMSSNHVRSFDPDDIIATDARVLVSDASAFTIHEFSHEGKYIGVFGADSLRKALRKPLMLKHSFNLMRYGMIAMVISLLILLVVVNNRHKRAMSVHRNSFHS